MINGITDLFQAAWDKFPVSVGLPTLFQPSRQYCRSRFCLLVTASRSGSRHGRSSQISKHVASCWVRTYACVLVHTCKIFIATPSVCSALLASRIVVLARRTVLTGITTQRLNFKSIGRLEVLSALDYTGHARNRGMTFEGRINTEVTTVCSEYLARRSSRFLRDSRRLCYGRKDPA